MELWDRAGYGDHVCNCIAGVCRRVTVDLHPFTGITVVPGVLGRSCAGFRDFEAHSARGYKGGPTRGHLAINPVHFQPTLSTLTVSVLSVLEPIFRTRIRPAKKNPDKFRCVYDWIDASGDDRGDPLASRSGPLFMQF